MIDLALDPSETRETRYPVAPPRRGRDLRVLLFGLAGLGVLGGFGVAASTLMAGLAAPAPVKVATTVAAGGRAADWPDLKDGLPAMAGAVGAKPADTQPAAPVAQAPRMASLSDGFTPAAAPIAPSPRAKAADVAELPTRRIPTPTPVMPVAASRQVVPLPPARTAALLPPRPAETVRARALVEPAAPPAPKPVAAAAPAATPEKPAKPAPKIVAAKPSPPVKTAEKAKRPAPATVAQAEAAEPEETEVLGIKLPSLAPAGRKLKESVDALGEAVKSVF
ncbi:hypothetical protein MKK69_15420 [Methylobacterium sp. J-026]|uniref:hypothetical protein n=1 Tax=Methylobacterium sp. J-026 TaxID=2836624 RepID=UPI001FBAB11A|nr:hypothetical protein [Methylobacterium sp. J-026]MCJ2135424.1 hypothetical protein [Methylobacterium sp. J-026]